MYTISGQPQQLEFRHRVECPDVDLLYAIPVEIESLQSSETFERALLDLLDVVAPHHQLVEVSRSAKETLRNGVDGVGPQLQSPELNETVEHFDTQTAYPTSPQVKFMQDEANPTERAAVEPIAYRIEVKHDPSDRHINECHRRKCGDQLSAGVKQAPRFGGIDGGSPVSFMIVLSVIVFIVVANIIRPIRYDRRQRLRK